MKKTTKEKIFCTVRSIIGALLLLITLLGGLMALLLIQFYTGNSFYIVLMSLTLLLTAAFAILLIIGKPKWKIRLISFGTAACLILGSLGGYQLYQLWENSIRLDEQGVDLTEYEPFAPNTKAATLNGPASLQLTEQEYLPRLDGATALYPVYSAFARAVYPEGDYPAYINPSDYFMTTSGSDDGGRPRPGHHEVVCTNTANAYERLITGYTDIIFAAAPSKAQEAAAASQGASLVMTPIGKEAFVFFVNKQNPVENLTVEQIRGIYSGAITNWETVGGKNKSIRAFQRPENSGSQSTLQKLMEGTPLMVPPQEDVVDGMGGIIHETAAYQNKNNALGYSFLFFATEMVKDNQIKLLHLNGIAPTRENIQNSRYPLASSFYAVTNGAPDESEQQLINWILSEQGQELIEKTGYTPIH